MAGLFTVRSLDGHLADEQTDEQLDEQLVTTCTQRLDLMMRLARVLLDEESLNEPVALQRTARLLGTEVADWVVIDVVSDDTLHRTALTGPSDADGLAVTQSLRQCDSDRDLLSRAAVWDGVPVCYPPLLPGHSPSNVTACQQLLEWTGAGALLSVPLHASGYTLGVLTLIRRAGFDSSELGLAEEIGEHLALAIKAGRSYQRRATIAEILQSSLLPYELPTPPGLEIAASHRAVGDGVAVGGDFYDVFDWAGGWGLVLGDVCGKGEEAAAVTAMVRHGVRILSVWDHEPAGALRQLNEAMIARQENERFVTVLTARLTRTPQGAQLRLASSGHPNAAVLHPDGRVDFVTGGGLPLGLFRDAAPHTQRVRLACGDTVWFYSDGITDARHPDGEPYGEDRFMELLASTAGMPVSSAIKTVEATITRASMRDDATLLAVQVTGQE